MAVETEKSPGLVERFPTINSRKNWQKQREQHQNRVPGQLKSLHFKWHISAGLDDMAITVMTDVIGAGVRMNIHDMGAGMRVMAAEVSGMVHMVVLRKQRHRQKRQYQQGADGFVTGDSSGEIRSHV